MAFAHSLSKYIAKPTLKAFQIPSTCRSFFFNLYLQMPSLCFLINCVLCLVAVIFVIDSNNIERITEAHEELAKLMAEKRLKDALLLIYANKQVQIVQLLFLAVVSLHVYLQFE